MGGGSPIDAAKIISALATNDKPVRKMVREASAQDGRFEYLKLYKLSIILGETSVHLDLEQTPHTLNMNPFLSAEFVVIVLLSAIGLIVLLLMRPALLMTKGGAALLFLALFVLPIASLRAGFRLHWESSKKTEFCMSCHVMEPYGQSLVVADEEYLPAAHFQNRRVEGDKACFECHSTYTMFGDTKAKLNGLQHLFVYYAGRTPDTIELYEPYHNRECLKCHRGSRGFVEEHEDDMDELLSNEELCLDCHDVGHEVETLDEQEMWKPSLRAALEER